MEFHKGLFYSALHYTSTARNPEICKLLLERGAMVNIKCSVMDETPLSLVLSFINLFSEPPSQWVKVVEVLLEYAANVMDKVRDRRALKTAGEFGGIEVVSKLLI